ncbi:DUF6069 family protein [Glycomyces algeriensis]|uniref:Uncharacterized protein n=1 Tax=Glycomyces algeriensis TaxID=256037 RepID=A0A9W6G9S9_9ACTN|nr:DUF6069 family protein [Glycomyces algeriensis]MDA1368995.1 DUF6069 family protein [Glycomyces algeriensis]MDR7350161.1 lysylphosphatidylglycerol synthetase-like protein (DUF2156 family) [Glycomyces algeriensis]GLI42873.1 hypothetical protein GALLR39Z86_27230 [Glycomyces algeriensis]
MTTRTRRLAAVLAATAGALLLWAAAVPLARVDLTVDQAGTPLTVGPALIAFAGLAVGFAAWGLLAVLERFAARAALIWSIIAAVVLAVSLTGPLAAATTAAMLVLMGMHVVTGGVLIAGLVRR